MVLFLSYGLAFGIAMPAIARNKNEKKDLNVVCRYPFMIIPQTVAFIHKERDAQVPSMTELIILT